jgi:hypothetical protein
MHVLFRTNRLLDVHNNGDLLADRINLNPMFELFLILFSVNDTSKIITIVQKYEFTLIRSLNDGESTLSSYLNESIYYLMLQHGLKSDILAEKLYNNFEPKITKKNLQMSKGSSKNSSLWIGTRHFFQFYLYLQIVETKGEIA